jgi:Restriction endonuclease
LQAASERVSILRWIPAYAAASEIDHTLAQDFAERHFSDPAVWEQDSEFFEKLVLDVLQAMGYGGSREDAAERLGQSGDEGIDGVIREDRLGLSAGPSDSRMPYPERTSPTSAACPGIRSRPSGSSTSYGPAEIVGLGSRPVRPRPGFA